MIHSFVPRMFRSLHESIGTPFVETFIELLNANPAFRQISVCQLTRAEDSDAINIASLPQPLAIRIIVHTPRQSHTHISCNSICELVHVHLLDGCIFSLYLTYEKI